MYNAAKVGPWNWIVAMMRTVPLGILRQRGFGRWLKAACRKPEGNTTSEPPAEKPVQGSLKMDGPRGEDGLSVDALPVEGSFMAELSL